MRTRTRSASTRSKLSTGRRFTTWERWTRTNQREPSRQVREEVGGEKAAAAGEDGDVVVGGLEPLDAIGRHDDRAVAQADAQALQRRRQLRAWRRGRR